MKNKAMRILRFLGVRISPGLLLVLPFLPRADESVSVDNDVVATVELREEVV